MRRCLAPICAVAAATLGLPRFASATALESSRGHTAVQAPVLPHTLDRSDSSAEAAVRGGETRTGRAGRAGVKALVRSETVSVSSSQPASGRTRADAATGSATINQTNASSDIESVFRVRGQASSNVTMKRTLLNRTVTIDNETVRLEVVCGRDGRGAPAPLWKGAGCYNQPCEGIPMMPCWNNSCWIEATGKMNFCAESQHNCVAKCGGLWCNGDEKQADFSSQKVQDATEAQNVEQKAQDNLTSAQINESTTEVIKSSTKANQSSTTMNESSTRTNESSAEANESSSEANESSAGEAGGNADAKGDVSNASMLQLLETQGGKTSPETETEKTVAPAAQSSASAPQVDQHMTLKSIGVHLMFMMMAVGIVLLSILRCTTLKGFKHI